MYKRQINIPTLLSNPEKEFLRGFFSISSTTVESNANSFEVHPVTEANLPLITNNLADDVYQVPEQMCQTDSLRDQNYVRSPRNTIGQDIIEDIGLSSMGYPEDAEMNMVLDQDLSEFSSNNENTRSLNQKSIDERNFDTNENHLVRRKM